MGAVWTFLLSTILSSLSPSLWETARYRLKYCLKGPLKPKQPTNQPTSLDKSRARAYCSCRRCGWGCLDIFTLIYPFFPLSPSLWETTRYRLKYCLKGSLSSKTTNQPTNLCPGHYLFDASMTNTKYHSYIPPKPEIFNSFLNTFSRGGRVVRWSWVNFQCMGRPTILIIVGQLPIALAVGAGGGGLDIFTLLYLFFPLSPSLWETA